MGRTTLSGDEVQALHAARARAAAATVVIALCEPPEAQRDLFRVAARLLAPMSADPAWPRSAAEVMSEEA